MIRVVVLRPEPGNGRTAARIERAGGIAIRAPLFAIRALDWQIPDPATFDSLLLTSASAPRLAGRGLDRLNALPVIAVGAATADAAREAGLHVAVTGDDDAATVLATARAAGFVRPLHLAGREHHAQPGVTAISVYASDRVSPAPDLAAAEGATVLLHSPRASRVFADIASAQGIDRSSVTLVAISASAAEAAGPGWRAVRVAAKPNDAEMCACAIDPFAPDGDKTV